MKKYLLALATVASLSASSSPNEDFFVAIEEGNVLEVERMIKNGIDVNIKDARGSTALMEAAARGYEKLVKLLIEKGADVNVQNSTKETALMNAA